MDLYYNQGTNFCSWTSGIGGAVPSQAMRRWRTARVWPDAPGAEDGVTEPAPVPGHGSWGGSTSHFSLFGQAWLSPKHPGERALKHEPLGFRERTQEGQALRQETPSAPRKLSPRLKHSDRAPLFPEDCCACEEDQVSHVSYHQTDKQRRRPQRLC